MISPKWTTISGEVEQGSVVISTCAACASSSAPAPPGRCGERRLLTIWMLHHPIDGIVPCNPIWQHFIFTILTIILTIWTIFWMVFPCNYVCILYIYIYMQTLWFQQTWRAGKWNIEICDFPSWKPPLLEDFPSPCLITRGYVDWTW